MKRLSVIFVIAFCTAAPMCGPPDEGTIATRLEILCVDAEGRQAHIMAHAPLNAAQEKATWLLWGTMFRGFEFSAESTHGLRGMTVSGPSVVYAGPNGEWHHNYPDAGIDRTKDTPPSGVTMSFLWSDSEPPESAHVEIDFFSLPGLGLQTRDITRVRLTMGLDGRGATWRHDGGDDQPMSCRKVRHDGVVFAKYNTEPAPPQQPVSDAQVDAELDAGVQP